MTERRDLFENSLTDKIDIVYPHDRSKYYWKFPKSPRPGGKSYQRGEVVHNSPEALYLYDSQGNVEVNGIPCKVLQRDYEIYEKNGRIVTILRGNNAR